MTFETWLALNQHPGESREEARERYIEEQGITNPAEKEIIKRELSTPSDYFSSPNYDYLDDTYEKYSEGLFQFPRQPESTTPYPQDINTEQYNPDPDWMDQIGAGFHEAGKGMADFVGGPFAGWMPEEYEDYIRESAEDWGAEQQRQADLVALPKTREEILEEDPDSLYSHLPEFWPTGHELSRSAPPSLTPAAIGLGVSVAGTPLLGAAGLTGMGLAAGSSLLAMGTGNLASSAMVSGEAYDRIKNDPTIREALGIDPNIKYQDLPPQEKKEVQEVAEDASQTSFGHRIYTSGLLEMLSFARYGGALFRWGMDMSLGASSEVWDNYLYAEDATDTLVEYGIPKDKAEAMRLKILTLGPSDKELWTKSLVQEGLYGGGFVGVESMVGDHRVDGPKTASKKLREVQEEFQKNRNQIAVKAEQQRLLGTDTKLRQKQARDALASENGYGQEENPWEAWEAEEKALENAYKFRAGQETYQAKRRAVKRANEIETKAELKSKKDQEVYAREEVAQMIRAEEESIKLARGTDFSATRQALAREREILDNIRTRLPSSITPVRKDGTLLTSEEIFDINAIKRKREAQLLKLQKREAALDKAQKDFEKAHPLKTAEQLDQETKKQAKKKYTPPKVLKSVIDETTTGEVTTDKDTLKRLFSMFKSKNKAKYVVLDKSEDVRLANIFGGEEYLAEAQGLLKDSEAFVHDDDVSQTIYLVAGNIKGETSSEAINRAVEVGVFHEPIAHLGLKKFFNDDKKFNAFLDDFYNNNAEDINEWARNEITPTGEAAYLDPEYDTELLQRPSLRQRLKLKEKTDTKLSTDKKRELAEEYLAHKFTEYGVRDPHILERLDDSLKKYLSSIVGKKRVSKIEARTILASIQRDYVGGKRNIITGDFFDPSNWVKSKPLALVKEDREDERVQTAEEKVKAYQEYLRKSGKTASVTEVAGQELLTEDVEAARKATKEAGLATKGVQPEIDRVEANKKARLRAEAQKLREKKQTKKAQEQAVKETLKILGIRSSKMSTPKEHQASINDAGLRFSKRTKPPPKKTFMGYKLLKMKKRSQGKLFPLYIGKSDPVDMNEWVDAEFIKTSGFSPRPGIHLTNLPFAYHIGTDKKPVGPEGKQKPTTRRHDEVWTVVEVADDVDWQPEADKRGEVYSKSHKLAGQIKPQTKEIKDEVPVDGNYRYKTNPNMEGEWIIAGAVKIHRILSDAEVDAINKENGYKDLPRKAPLDVETFGFKTPKYIRSAKQKIKAYGGTAQVEQNVIAALQANPKLAPLIEYMTPEELDLLTPKSAERMLATLEGREGISIIPDETGLNTAELISMALAGQIHKGWYINSLGAVNHVFGADAPRFLGLLAALSPKSTVQASSLEATSLWAAWIGANRPTNKADIVKLATKAVSRFGKMTMLHGNVVRTLTAKNPKKLILSGPKVQSFHKNLMGNLDEVTHDVWQWNAYGILGNKIGQNLLPSGVGIKMPTYTIASAKLREAADMLTQQTGQTWEPAEVQETIWSFYKALMEFSAAEPRRKGRTLEDVVTQEDLTQQIHEIPDFANLLNGTAPQKGKAKDYATLINNILTKAGYGKQLTTLSAKPVVSQAMGGVTPTHRVRGIGKVGRRLEASRPKWKSELAAERKAKKEEVLKARTENILKTRKSIGRIRASKKVKTLGATGGGASLIEWADQGKWFNFGPVKTMQVFVNIIASVDHQITSFLMNPESEYAGIWNYKYPEEFIKTYQKKLDGVSIEEAVKRIEEETQIEEVLATGEGNDYLLRRGKEGWDKNYEDPLPIYNQVLKEMGRTWNDILVHSWIQDSKFNTNHVSYESSAKKIIEAVFDPFITNLSVKAPHRLETVSGYIDSRLANPELLHQNQQLVERVAYWGLDAPLDTKRELIDATDNLKRDWLEIIQNRHNEIIDYNADYLEQQYQHDPTFQSAMMRANLYGRRNDTIDMPAEFKGSALVEVWERFKEGEYASLKHMKKDYAIIAKRKSDEEDAREKRRSARIPSTEDGVWVELKQVPEDATPEEAKKIYRRWKEASYENWCTHSFASETYPHDGPMYVLTRDEEPLIAIRYIGNNVQEIRSQANNDRVPLKYIPDIKAFLEGMQDLDPDRMNPQSQRVLENAEAEAKVVARIDDKVKPIGKKKSISEWKELRPKLINNKDWDEIPKKEWYEYIELKDGTWAVTGLRYEGFTNSFRWDRFPDSKDYPVTILVGDLKHEEFSRGHKGESSRSFESRKNLLKRDGYDRGLFPKGIKEIAGEVILSGVTIDDLHTVQGTFTAGEDQGAIKQIDRRGQTAEEARLELEEIKEEYKAKGLLDTSDTDASWLVNKWIPGVKQTDFQQAEGELIERVSQITYLPALRDVGEGTVTLKWNVSIPNLVTLTNHLDLHGDADIPKLETVETITLSSYGAHAPALMNVNDDFIWDIKSETTSGGRPAPHIVMHAKNELPPLDFNKLEEVGGRVSLSGFWHETVSPKDLQLESLHSIGESLSLSHKSNPPLPNLYMVKGSVYRTIPTTLTESSVDWNFGDKEKNKNIIKDKDVAKNAEASALHAPNLTLVGHSITIYEHDYLPNLQRVGKDIKIYINGDLEQVQKTLARMDKEGFLPSLTHVGGEIMIFAPEVDKSKYFATRFLHPGGRISTLYWNSLVESERVDSDFTGYADKTNFHHKKFTSNKYSKAGLARLAKEAKHAEGTDPQTGEWFPPKEYGDFKPQGVAIMSKGDHAIVSTHFPNIAPQLEYTYGNEANPTTYVDMEKNVPQIDYSQSRWFSAVWEGTELDPRKYGIPKVDSKSSKLKKIPNAEELEAEWRSIQETKKTSDTELPRKGDKVTLSKEARTLTRASKLIQKKEYADVPTGKEVNIKNEKITSSVSRALNRIKKLGRKNSFNPDEIVIGATAIEIEPHTNGKVLWYKDIRSFEKGKGHATKTMKLVQKIADEEGVNLVSYVSPFGVAPMSKNQLLKWYKRIGWDEWTEGPWVDGIIYRGEHIVIGKKMRTIPMDKESAKIIESKPTKKDLTPEAILDPKGNVRSSKILMSRAAKHAIDTRSWNPLKRWTDFSQPFADRLTKRIVSQGTLPDSAKYKALRRKVKGIILAGETAGKKVYDALKKSKQKDLIFKYLTTKNFDPNKIKNLKERQTAISAKKKINEIGEMLVDRKLMKRKTKEHYEGEYLPKVYLKYLLGEENFRKATTKGGLGLDMSYLIGRKDIPEGVRKLILGEIEDPGYLASKAIGVPQKDIAIIDWLKSIAGNPNWVLPSSLVRYDVLGKMKSLTASVDLQKRLELIDTRGSSVSAYWLANEADRIFKQVKYLNLNETERKIVEDLSKDMEEVAQSQMEKSQGKIDHKKYSLVPTTPKYGQLAGMAVRKEIAQDIFGSMNMQTGDISTAEKVFGDTGKVGDYNRLWKWAKVSANPPSWVRNFISNLTLMNLGDVPFARMPDLMLSSLSDMLKKGKHQGRLHQLAKDIGLTSGNFSTAELGRIEKEFKDMMQRLDAKDKTTMAVLGPIKGALNILRDGTSDFYGGIDSLGKMMMLKYKMEKAGLKIKDIGKYSDREMEVLHDAAYDAEKYLFDYSNPLPSVKWIRRAPFGAPFISFTSFVAPLVLETAITKPWKFLPYYLLGWSAKEFFKSVNDLDEEEYDGLKVSMSDYLREKFEGVGPYPVIPWPYLDENGRVQFIDVSYLFPWGMFSELLGELFENKPGKAIRTAGLMGSPALTTASAIISGVDGFTRKPIVDDYGTFSEQIADMMWFAFNLTMPPMLHGIGQGPEQGYGAVKRLWEAGTGQLTKEGEARFTLGQASARMFGINVTPIAVPEGRNKQLRYEYSRIQKLLRLAKRDLVNMTIMQEDKADIQETAKDYREKIQELVKDFQAKTKISAPPISLLRQREKALREQKKQRMANQTL